jgi:hypothetical protein
MPGAQPHPQSSWAEKENAHKSSGRAEIARHSLRNGFTAAPRSPQSTGLVSLCRLSTCDRRLSTSVGVPGPHGLTVRFRRASPARQPASIAARTTNRDDRETPLMRAG